MCNPSGKIEIDPTGKLAGRGAYLCRDRECWLTALSRKRIEQALKRSLTPEEHARMEAHAMQLPERSADGT